MDRRTDRHDHRSTDHVGLAQARPNKVQPVLSQIRDYRPLSVLLELARLLFKLTSLNWPDYLN